MAKAEKLTATKITERTAEMPGWSVRGGEMPALVKRFTFADFAGSLAFVNQLGAVAEKMQHHPDLDIRYNLVTVALSTHDSGGITALDFDLAAEAEKAAGAAPPLPDPFANASRVKMRHDIAAV